MHISKVRIENFKSFRKPFSMDFTDKLNIIVGNNEEGKSTILEAIHLSLSGLYNGKYLRNELSEYLFNNEAVEEYKKSLEGETPLPPPQITIEIFIGGGDLPAFTGDKNSTKGDACGFTLKILLDERYHDEYEEYVKNNFSGVPIEFYECIWENFGREIITPKKIPVKSALIDSSSNRYNNGSDIYINHIIKNHLDTSQKNSLTQAHRKLQTTFVTEEAVIKVNDVIKAISKQKAKDKQVTISVDLSSRNAWENSILTYVEDVPFHHIGKGQQSIVKTKLALQHKKAQEANLILLEEPENHLSHSRLNYLIEEIKSKHLEKQIIISTHSSFVSNKLGLDNLIILNEKKNIPLTALETSTRDFFKKIPGYDTLRLILCKKAILVEGDSDELIVQKAYLTKYGCLPIENEIDVISVGTSFLRFLQIAEKIGKKVAVVTDNDSDIEALENKYKDYLGENAKPNIKICYDKVVDVGDLIIKGKAFNYNTLEPKMIKANTHESIAEILEVNKNGDDLLIYMNSNKTECALKIFDTGKAISFPEYIIDSINE